MLIKIFIGIILFFVVCAIFCGIGGLLFGSDLPANSTVKETSVSTEPLKLPLKTPLKTHNEILNITSKKLIEDYNNNELAADKIYKGTTYNITGKIIDISDILGQITVTLSDDSEFCLLGVSCIFKEKEKDNLIKINKGDVITVQGTIEGQGFSINVKNCRLIK